MPVTRKNLFFFWPVALLLTGIICICRRRYNYKDQAGKSLGPFSRAWRICGIVLIAAGSLFLLNNYPFIYYRFDQYRGDQRAKPYQHFIDYVAKHGGLTYWLHPEARNIDKVGIVNIETEAYPEALLATRDYTGFAIFYDGYEKVGRPGGLWDKILNQYCQGKRDKPVWAIGTLGIDAAGNLDHALKGLRTVLLVSALNKKEVYDALREGRCYVVVGKDAGQISLDTFSIKDSDSASEKIMGQQLICKGTPEIKIKGNLLHGQGQVFKIKLIKDGTIIKTFEASPVFDITYQDPELNDMSYYRIEIESPGLKAITNPIFVRKEKAR